MRSTITPMSLPSVKWTRNIFIPIYAKNGVTDRRVVEYMSHYFISGVSAITMEWVKRGCEDDILFICEVISICVRPQMKASDLAV